MTVNLDRERMVEEDQSYFELETFQHKVNIHHQNVLYTQ